MRNPQKNNKFKKKILQFFLFCVLCLATFQDGMGSILAFDFLGVFQIIFTLKPIQNHPKKQTYCGSKAVKIPSNVFFFATIQFWHQTLRSNCNQCVLYLSFLVCVILFPVLCMFTLRKFAQKK